MVDTEGISNLVIKCVHTFRSACLAGSHFEMLDQVLLAGCSGYVC